MKSYSLPIILMAFWLQACGPAQKDTFVDSFKTKTDSIIPGAETTIKQETEKTFTLETLPDSWIMLTNQLKGYVVYQSCNGEIPTIDIRKTEDGYELNYLMGQSQEVYKILRFERTGDRQYELICDHNQTAKIVYKEPENDLSEWTWYYTDSKEPIHETEVYVTKTGKDKYPFVKEGDCEEMF